MSTRNALLAAVALAAAALLYGVLLYPSLPDRIPVHWNINGEVDGWGSRAMGVFLLPGMMGVLTALLFVLPAISPRHFQVESFRETYNYVVVAVIALMGYIDVVALQAALHGADLGRLLIGGIFVFFALIGNVMGKVRRNFWMGVRTPWTLASDTVWIATHRLAARLWTAAGLGCALLLLLGVPVAVCFAIFITAALAPVVYSLVLYKQLEHQGRA